MSVAQPKTKFVDSPHHFQNEWYMHDLPPQLQSENIDAFLSRGYGDAILVVDDAASRKKMHRFQSIAQRMATRILLTPVGTSYLARREKTVAKYSNTKKESIKSLLELDEFADVRDLVADEILPHWGIDEFVAFFSGTVKLIVDRRQMNGFQRVCNEQYLQNSPRRRKSQEPSLKQQFRTTKKKALSEHI